MLAHEVDLFFLSAPIPLGDLVLASKYLFSLLFLLWCAGAWKWRSGRYVFAGSLVLSTFGMLTVSLPLARPYGITEQGGGLRELALPMVTASRTTPAEGWLAGERNPSPAWSVLLATVSGFEPSRLFAQYTWVPIFVQVFLAFGLYSWIRWLEGDHDRFRLAGGLAVFFYLMLGTHRLSFLGELGTGFNDALWLRPRIGFGLGLMALFFLGFARARSLPVLVGSGGLLAVMAWTEPGLALISALAVVFAWLRSGRQKGFGRGVVVTVSVALAAHALWPVPWTWTSGTSLQELVSATLDRGLVFLLAVYGIWNFESKRDLSSALLAGAGLIGFLLFLFSVGGSGVGEAALGLVLAGAAGLGASAALSRLAELVPRRAVLPFFLVSCLPWCFPYWWFPVRMDSTYEACLRPISRQRIELAEWIRAETPADSVFVAGPSYAPWIGALAGRRLVSVDGRDEGNPRDLAFDAFARGSNKEAIRNAARTFGVTHVAWGRLDPPIDSALLARSTGIEVHRQGRWVIVYELVK